MKLASVVLPVRDILWAYLYRDKSVLSSVLGILCMFSGWLSFCLAMATCHWYHAYGSKQHMKHECRLQKLESTVMYDVCECQCMPQPVCGVWGQLGGVRLSPPSKVLGNLISTAKKFNLLCTFAGPRIQFW